MKKKPEVIFILTNYILQINKGNLACQESQVCQPDLCKARLIVSLCEAAQSLVQLSVDYLQAWRFHKNAYVCCVLYYRPDSIQELISQSFGNVHLQFQSPTLFVYIDLGKKMPRVLKCMDVSARRVHVTTLRFWIEEWGQAFCTLFLFSFPSFYFQFLFLITHQNCITFMLPFGLNGDVLS